MFSLFFIFLFLFPCLSRLAYNYITISDCIKLFAKNWSKFNFASKFIKSLIITSTLVIMKVNSKKWNVNFATYKLRGKYTNFVELTTLRLSLSAVFYLLFRYVISSLERNLSWNQTIHMPNFIETLFEFELYIYAQTDKGL